MQLESSASTSGRKIKVGAVLSYVAVIFEIVVNFFVISKLANQLGSSYGIYTLALNIIGLFLIDFGLNQSVTKFICKYRANGDAQSEKAFLGVITKMYLVLDLIVFVAALIVFFFLKNIYSGISPELFPTFKNIYIIVTIYSIISVPFMPLTGILTAYEEFAFIKVVGIIQKAVSGTAMLIAVSLRLDIYTFIIINVATGILSTLIRLIWLFAHNKMSINIKAKDSKMVKDIFSFTLWIAISSIASRLSVSILPTLLASTQSENSVAILGIAITFETYAYTFSTALSNLFLPKITKLVEENNHEAIKKDFYKIGKIQMFIIGIIFVGFFIVGKEFLALYLPSLYSESYWPTVFLIGSIVFESTTIIAVLHSYAINTIKYVSIIDLAASLIRAVVCWVCGKYFGVFGLSTAFFILGIAKSLLISILVFERKQHLGILSFFAKVYLRWIPTFLVTFAVTLLLKIALAEVSWVSLILKIVTIIFVYSTMAYITYFSYNEKETIFRSITSKPGFISRIIFKISERTKNGSLAILLPIIIVLSFFASNYPFARLSLVVLIVIFVFSLLTYLINVFPALIVKKENIKNIIIVFRHVTLLSVFMSMLLLLINFLATRSFISFNGYLKQILLLWCAFFIVECFEFKKFKKYFIYVFNAICVVSIFITIVTRVFGDNVSPNMSGKYYNYFFIYFSTINTTALSKNFAIFWEPGIFASFAIIAIIMVLCFRDKPLAKNDYLCMTLYVVSIILSGSTAGYILLVLLIPIVLLVFIKNKKVSYTISAIFTLISVGIVAFFPEIYNNILYKIPFIYSKGVSLTTRYLSIQIDLELFFKHPIFGLGNSYSEHFFELANTKYHGLIDASLSTTGYLLAAYGLFGIFAFLTYVFAVMTIPKQSLVMRFNLLFITFLIINKEPHHLSILSIVLLFYCVKDADWLRYKTLFVEKGLHHLNLGKLIHGYNQYREKEYLETEFMEVNI